jgi:dipeptidyl aminopeptidase/acylaminoacyl peptidase
MAELKEIFEMVTQKTEPKDDAWREQEERQRRQARARRLGAFAAVAAIAAVAIAAAMLSAGFGGSQTPATTPSDTPVALTTHFLVDVATGGRSPASPVIPGARLLAVSPDGDTIAYNTCCTKADAMSLVAMDGSADRTIADPPLSGYAATWSADGSTIVFQGRNPGTYRLGGLYTYDVAAGARAQIVDFGTMRSGSWIVPSDISPDGGTVLYHLPREDPATWDLWTAPITGGTPTLVRRNAGFASYAPDGSIVYLDHPQNFTASSIWIMNGDGTGARVLVDGGGSLEWPKVSPDGTKVAYDDGGHTYVVDVSTLRVTDLGPGTEPAWVDNDTLIVG